jgi:phenylalanine-4-hydroxylase
MTTKTNSPKSLSSLTDIPEHLHEYITEQDPSLYTPEDHASWRFIMRVSKSFFKTHAHPLYLAGLEATGIATERIPLISEMNSALKKMGWRAVAINGFIPPSIFLEMQSLKILAIACDMRKIENLGYTPSPDIVHEAAGHAPIVCDPNYRAYLEAYGQVARNAILSKQDLELYDVIFELSEIKENPKALPEEIALVQKKFEEVAATETEPSEAALLTRMAWWTTEYGMIDVNGTPLIYGAGLLSSILESHQCIHPHVKKIPFTLEAAINTSYDITRPQPQLFVTKDFETLTKALDDFANNMAFRKGGAYGLKTAEKAATTVTVALDSGIQLSGVVAEFETGNNDEVLSLTLIGTKQISYHEEAMTEFGYAQFGSKIHFPMFDPSISTVPTQEILKKLHGSGLSTKSGNRMTGQFKKEIKLGTGGKLLILEKVKIVSPDGKVVFEEKTKPYPFVLGSKVTSVFGGAADRKEFALRHSNMKKKVKSHKSNATPENKLINALYLKIRKLRESGRKDVVELEEISLDAKENFPNAWLIHLEILEIYKKYQITYSQSATDLESNLIRLSKENNNITEQINMGMELLK